MRERTEQVRWCPKRKPEQAGWRKEGLRQHPRQTAGRRDCWRPRGGQHWDAPGSAWPGVVVGPEQLGWARVVLRDSEARRGRSNPGRRRGTVRRPVVLVVAPVLRCRTAGLRSMRVSIISVLQKLMFEVTGALLYLAEVGGLGRPRSCRVVDSHRLGAQGGLTLGIPSGRSSGSSLTRDLLVGRLGVPPQSSLGLRVNGLRRRTGLRSVVGLRDRRHELRKYVEERDLV